MWGSGRVVGAGRHPTACIVACALCSVADHTLSGRDALGDVLERGEKHKSNFITFLPSNENKNIADMNKIFITVSFHPALTGCFCSFLCFHLCFLRWLMPITSPPKCWVFYALPLTSSYLCDTKFPRVVSESPFYLHKHFSESRTSLEAENKLSG